MADKHQAFMHYCEAWKASPRVAALSLEAYKGFFEILNSIWLAECMLTDDEQTLIGASRLTAKQWKKAKAELFGGRKPLLRRDGGYVINDRLFQEWERTQGLRQERSESGKRGAKKRWQKHSKAMAKPSQSHRFANGKTMQTETETETREECTSAHSSGARPPIPTEPVNREPGYDCEPGLLRFRVKANRLAEHRWSQDAEHAWTEVVSTQAIEDRVFAGMLAWEESRDWRDGVFKGWARWLRDLDFEKKPNGKPKVISDAERRQQESQDNIKGWLSDRLGGQEVEGDSDRVVEVRADLP